MERDSTATAGTSTTAAPEAPADGTDRPAQPAPAAPSTAWLSRLRTIAAVGVVVIHTAGATAASPDLVGSAAWWTAAFPRMVAVVTVPLFVMVSGALLLDRRGYGVSAFYRRRVGRIGIPLAFWHVVQIALSAVLAAGLMWRHELGLLLGGRTTTGMYFLWLIIGLYAVTPALWVFVDRYGARGCQLLGGALVAVTVLHSTFASVVPVLGVSHGAGEPTIVTWFVPYVGYYVLGRGLRDVRVPVPAAWALVGLVLAQGLLACLMLGWPDQTWLHRWSVLSPLNYLSIDTAVAAAAAFVAAGTLLRGRRRAVIDLSFGIFLIHILLLRLVQNYVTDYAVADTVLEVLALFGGILAAAWVIAWGWARVPFLRATIGVSAPRPAKPVAASR